MKPMQSMFPRKRHQVPSLNVASMPDLIFTVLFFFMIVTHMRSDEVKVKLQVPQGKDVQKLANKASVVNIYIGQFKGEWAVQLNGDHVRGYKSYGYDYVNRIGYDKFEQRTYLKYCNGAETFYSYDPQRQHIANSQK